ncbi:MAG TPA: flagellar basal body P-ring protein FlgI [Gemmatimonadales bacterium]|nr:flagellar basal body P-ring protein FlgI [Gemmatimonadales bacterium]
MTIRGRLFPLLLAAACGAALARPGRAQTARIADLVSHSHDVPRRLVGYGLVVGLGGTGDQSFGTTSGGVHTVRSVLNLLRRFDIAVPPDRLRLRNVAAVLVTAEVSPYLRAGNHFDVQVGSIGDATALKGGVLWMTPLIEDVGQAPVATAQGPLLTVSDLAPGASARGGTSARVPAGGLLEVDAAAQGFASAPGGAPDTLRLLLRQPNLERAARIAAAINAAYGAGAAVAEDPGAVRVTPPAGVSDTVAAFLAAVDTLPVQVAPAPELVVDARDGTVATGGELRIGAAAVSHGSLTLTIGGGAASGTGLVHAEIGATAEDVAAALHVAGARPRDIAAIFEALAATGALRASVVIQ